MEDTLIFAIPWATWNMLDFCRCQLQFVTTDGPCSNWSFWGSWTSQQRPRDARQRHTATQLILKGGETSCELQPAVNELQNGAAMALIHSCLPLFATAFQVLVLSASDQVGASGSCSGEGATASRAVVSTHVCRT